MNSILEYKGYHAEIKFDADDEIFVGEVFGIADSLSFHGQSTSEIKEMFHQSIDNYLKLCKDIGKNPDKEFKGVFNVRITPENHKKAALEAKKRGIKLNQFVSDAIEHELNSENKLNSNVTLIIKNIQPTTMQNYDFTNFEDHSIFKNEKIYKTEVTN